MDLFWLVVVLCSWRVLTREYWRTNIVPADARMWAWLGRCLPERGLLALYRATFFYGLCRMIAWSAWAHLVARPVIDGVRTSTVIRSTCRGRGRGGSKPRSLHHVSPWVVLPVTLAFLAAIYFAIAKLWDRMGRRDPWVTAIGS